MVSVSGRRGVVSVIEGVVSVSGRRVVLDATCPLVPLKAAPFEWRAICRLESLRDTQAVPPRAPAPCRSIPFNQDV